VHNPDNAPNTEAQDLTGLRVRLRPCRACGCISAAIIKNNAIACESCGRKRGKVDDDVQRFLRDLIAHFGRPTAPIEIRPPSSPAAPAGGA
jgi:hypothetical protein